MQSSETTAPKPRHPGRGKGKGRLTPKGHELDPKAEAEISALLGDRPRRADLLIEHLHLIQDRFGHLCAAHLHALAEEMKMAQTELFEVATFYAHFDVVREGEAPPPAVTIRVCESLTCNMMGAEAMIDALHTRYDQRGVRIVRAPCMGRCHCAPSAEIGHRHLDHASLEKIEQIVDSGHFHPEIPDYADLEAYRADGGYKTLARVRSGEISFEALTQTLLNSGLRGLGGAGFPTGRKWQLVRSAEGPRYACVNGDEGEVGTFKDRFYLESDPHRFIEGALIAAHAVEAKTLFFYMRDEYPAVLHILRKEIAALEAAGLVEPGYIDLRRGAGAYICGEESAMIESIEGKRGLPRHRPPYVAQVGVFGRPTLVNNIETLHWVRDIIEKGPAWFADHGIGDSNGLRSYSVSGRVRSPGVKITPAGITVRQLIDDYCGGMSDGHTFHAYLPGGASGGILPASMGDLSLDFGKLEQHGSFVGSHAVVILSDKDDVRKAATNLMKFFEAESCGQCTPCRAGTEKAVKLMQREVWDQELLEELAQAMTDASICGLGQAAANPLKSVFRFFNQAS